ncbi:hypothetical protein JL721_4336 [Aureococcus anophagefferens]|nr:hypothetical protein JL721_4336 [Aureococcus anophagefferens]
MWMSLMIVMLVAIGFTRLLFLALDLRDDYEASQTRGDGASVARRRRHIHERMECQAKPRQVERIGEGSVSVYAPVGEFVGGRDVVSSLVDAMLCGEDTTVDAPKKKTVASDADDAAADDDDLEAANAAAASRRSETSECCSICFERAPNAVFLRTCGHGGCCYSCAVDVCATSRTCPFCRGPVEQVVIVDLASAIASGSDAARLDVVGPGMAFDGASTDDEDDARATLEPAATPRSPDDAAEADRDGATPSSRRDSACEPWS